jgi:cyclophilin family peptidyl-prolyl cis-trans isomerase
VPTEKRLRKREGRQARLEEMRRAQQQARQRRLLIYGAVAVVIVVGLSYLVSRGSGKKKSTALSTTTSTTISPSTTRPGSTTTTVPPPPPVSVPTIAAPANVGCPKFDGSAPHYTKFTAAPAMCINPAKTYTITFQTDAGTFAAVLDQKAAPKTANNFAVLAAYHYFDGIAFHRVIPGFVIQGGDPTGTGSGGPGYSFADELPAAGQYKVGSLAMANSGANTNGSQFFVITGAQGAALPPSYSLFGAVTTGLDVVKKIEADGSAAGTPVKQHTMVKVTVAES